MRVFFYEDFKNYSAVISATHVTLLQSNIASFRGLCVANRMTLTTDKLESLPLQEIFFFFLFVFFPLAVLVSLPVLRLQKQIRPSATVSAQISATMRFIFQ